MAWQDRPYYGGGEPDYTVRSPLAGATMWSVNTWLIITCIAVYVVDAIIGRAAGEYYLSIWGNFSAQEGILQGQIWRLITFQFLHSHKTIWHLLFNMLMLFFFGMMVERYLGSRRYLAFYLLSGMAGPIAYMLLWLSGLVVSRADVRLVGASAGVFGVLVGAAMIAPDVRVWVLMLFPVKLKWVAWGLVGIAAFTVLARGNQPMQNAGGEAAHLGGALVGFLLIRRPDWLNIFERIGGGRSPAQVAQRFSQAQSQRRLRKQQQDQEEIDRILAKVHEQGINSLTSREKRTLQRATEKQRGG